MIESWRGWPGRRLALCGPEASGKTHLAHVCAAESAAALARGRDLDAASPLALLGGGALVVEDADRLGAAARPAEAEAALHHLLNLAAAEGAALLLTGRAAPAHWPAALPDLRSRLSALSAAQLRAPDDALLTAVIAKLLDDRSLAFEAGLPAYLARRIERSFAAAHAIVEALDAGSLAARRPITRKLAAELLA